MNSAKIAVTGLIVTLVAFVVAVPVLGALFSDGGSFDQLEQVVTGTERTIPGSSVPAYCEYTRWGPQPRWNNSVNPYSPPGSVLTANRLTFTETTSQTAFLLGNEVYLMRATETVPYGTLINRLARPVGAAWEIQSPLAGATGNADVRNIYYIAAADGTNRVVGWSGSTNRSANFNCGSTGFAAPHLTLLVSGAVARPGRTSHAASVTPPRTVGAPTAITNSPYAPILTAIFGLIPLGLMLAVGWYFIGQRMMSGNGGGRRRRRR